MRPILNGIPNQLQDLQNKIYSIRKNQKLELQNGDMGSASAPSNIALIKYWGKQPNQLQIPTNSSLSLTLNGFQSRTKVFVLGRFFPASETPPQSHFCHKLLLKNENQEIISNQMPEKMVIFLNSILNPYAEEIGLQIESENNFPTACGIASSASGYAALVLAVANLLQLEKHFTKEEVQTWVSEWSRLGSGSAIRSSLLENDSLFVGWKLNQEKNSSTTKVENIPYHKNWKSVQHCVFVLNQNEKKVTSSEGHKSAQTSPFHNIRVAGIKNKIERMEKALLEFDFEIIKQISEEDAFQMHAVMQTGTPSACYLNSEVGCLIAKFIEFRDYFKLQAFWTLDAGPNVHFIYMEKHRHLMYEFLNEMKKYLKKEIRIYENIN